MFLKESERRKEIKRNENHTDKYDLELFLMDRERTFGENRHLFPQTDDIPSLGDITCFSKERGREIVSTDEILNVSWDI